MVDAADHDKIEASRNEFHNLLDKPQLAGIPVLVLANKRDVAGAMDEREVIDKMYVLLVLFYLLNFIIYLVQGVLLFLFSFYIRLFILMLLWTSFLSVVVGVRP